MNLKARLIHPQIVHVKYKNQYDLTSTFIRIQEFYESPLDYIRNRRFDLVKFVDEYIKEYGVFDYYTKWSGFNFPDHVLKIFIKKQNTIYDKEKSLIQYIKCLVDWKKPFYVIGTFDDADIDHELAHAFYYLSETYRKKMDYLNKSISATEWFDLVDYLNDIGYHSSVFHDEIQAYLSTKSKPIDNMPKQELLEKFFKIFETEKQKLLS